MSAQPFTDPGFPIRPTFAPLGFSYGPNVFGPTCEIRTLDAIRPSLRNHDCAGPDPVYAIAMDVGTADRRADLLARNLLYGAVVYAAGRLGDEPVRSQGHVHAISQSCGASTPELYEIWTGKAVILMQEFAENDPGRCFAVHAGPGDKVVVPPGWAHATISANPNVPLAFGAWCVRDFGFDYTGVRAHAGLAWFPILAGDTLSWERNPRYSGNHQLIEKSPEPYHPLGLLPHLSIWQQYLNQPDSVMWVPQPQRATQLWHDFIP